MPIKIAVCDDEKIMHEHITRLIKNQYEDCHIDLYDSGDTLLATNFEYDIYFLDIQMPGINGLKVAEQLRKRQRAEPHSESAIIFVTALREYMADAFDVKAYHYLIKPIDEDKFGAVFLKVVDDFQRIEEKTKSYLLVKNRDTHYKIALADILFIESRSKKIIVNAVNGVTECYGKMQDIEDNLGNAFFRCHRCYIVNMENIIRYNADTIRMKNGSEILLAQKKYPQFEKAYMAFARKGGYIRG